MASTLFWHLITSMATTGPTAVGTTVEASQGKIGLRVNGIPRGEGPCRVHWRDVRIRELKPDESVLERR
jgi:hypothetical protein